MDYAFIIDFQGRIIDRYNHERDTYACDDAVINDFLDERNNCYFSKNLPDDTSDKDEDDKPKKLSRRKSASSAMSSLNSRRLVIRSEANRIVAKHQDALVVG